MVVMYDSKAIKIVWHFFYIISTFLFIHKDSGLSAYIARLFDRSLGWSVSFGVLPNVCIFICLV